MTEHSAEELKRQYEAAKSRRIEAQEVEAERRDAYHAALIRDADAEFAANGITPGTKVRLEWTDWRGVPFSSEAFFVGHYKTWRGIAAKYLKIKKDGTAGKQEYRPPHSATVSVA